MEILLIHDNPADIGLVQQALAERHIPSNLTILSNGLEAFALLHKLGRFAHAPTPDLIIIGGELEAPGNIEMLKAIQATPRLRRIPLVVVAAANNARQILAENQLEVILTVRKPDDLEQFENLLESLQGICLTLVEAPR